VSFGIHALSTGSFRCNSRRAANVVDINQLFLQIFR